MVISTSYGSTASETVPIGNGQAQRIPGNNHENENDHVTESSEDELRRIWMESPFASGYGKPSWKDEKVGLIKLVRSCTLVHCSACICSNFPCVGRVGNMPVLKQQIRREEGVGSRQKPLIQCIVGPFWPIPFFITLPSCAAFAAYTFWSRDMHNESLGLVIPWAVLNFTSVFSLIMVACSDPGILHRHAEPADDSWRWNDQAMTYRPPHAKFDPECGVVINEFDHTCPWTGTGIGANNMKWFRVFLASVSISIMMNLVLLVYLKG